ncbi:MAG: amidohydrolase family protein [Gemmatimonas sp.]
MSARRIAYHARWVLPIASSAIADGAIVVEGGTIQFVGTSAEAKASPHVDEHVELGNSVLMPGLVNAHTHLELTVLRGFLDGLPFEKWLRVLTVARNEVLDAEALLVSATTGIHEGLLAGVTTYADCAMSTAPLAAMRAMGVRGIGYVEVFGPDASQAPASLAALQQTVETERRLDTALVRTGASPHAPYTVSADLFRGVASWACGEGLQLAVHVAESHDETRFVRDGAGPFADRLRARSIDVKATGRSPVQLLADTGMLGRNSLLIHGVQMDDADIDLAAQSDSAIVHCPVSNAKLGQGVAPLSQFLRAGIRTGLGTDSVASNNRMSMLSEARMAVLLQSVQQRVPDAVSAQEALRLATLGGAQALGMDAETGSLEVGKSADIAAFRLDRIEARSPFEVESTLVHALGGAATASLVLVAGVPRLRDGQVLEPQADLYVQHDTLRARLADWRT